MNAVLLQAESQTHVPCHDCAQTVLLLFDFIRLLHKCVQVYELLEHLKLQPNLGVVWVSSRYEGGIGFSKTVAVEDVKSYMTLSA